MGRNKFKYARPVTTQKTSSEPQRINFYERLVNRRSWYLISGFLFYLAASMVLRAILLECFTSGFRHSPLLSIEVLGTGLRCDATVGLILFFPLVLWLQLSPEKFFRSKFHQLFLKSAFAFYLIAQSFMFVVEFEFFDEFNSRFNTVAVDYLIYPQEVFVNIWESYPVLKIFTLTILIGLLGSFVPNRFYRRQVDINARLRHRFTWIGSYLALIIGALFLQMHEPGQFNGDRVVREIALNGSESFFDAAITHELNYQAFYSTLDAKEAYDRARKLVGQPQNIFTDQADSLQRLIAGTTKGKPKNLVILIVESFGSEFWGSLGRTEPTLTPEMDALSKEGLLFTNLYASGNRTVRGLEGILASFPPLPGDSILKRTMSDNISTLARVLKTNKYETLFLYGGRGIFDGMKPFMTANGYDRFIEQKDFSNPTFSTIWGVCDEDLYHRGIEEFRALHKSGKPFLATFMSVSNHTPFTYPPGRIPEDPNKHFRSHAVKYTDWTLGDFFRLAKKEEFYKDTIFAVVADHGARVYGSQKIPIPSYRIPLLIVAPGMNKVGRIDMLGGSLDVGPTLLGLLGLPYKSVFFGQNLLTKNPSQAWAVMHHNRDIGLLRGNKLAVLGLKKTLDFYQLSNDRHDLSSLKEIGPEEEDLKKDAMALFQVADDLYIHQRYNTK